MSEDKDKVVSILKAQHRTLDESVHSLAKETARIKDICLKNQEDISELKDDMTVVKAQIVVLRDDMNKRFDSVDQRFDSVNQRFDQLELLIRQALPTN